jgi:subtilase family serine protease
MPGGGVIAIVELGGGWQPSDMQQFFSSIFQPTPLITEISVDGTKNTPGGDADAEVALDIQVAGASYLAATGKPADIRVYWADNEKPGSIAAAIRAAAADGCDVCSISWGMDESGWARQDAEDLARAAAEANRAGMIVFAAAGDNDASDGGATPANVDLPASCIHVIGCGGTRKPQAGPEVVWNANPGNPSGEGTGGGYSTIFVFQHWMIGAPIGQGRMVPDIAANADPDTGYEIVLDGQLQPVGGTSAVAPLYAGLFAAFGRKLNTANDRVSAVLWRLGHLCFNDITSGDNGLFRALPGPDAVSGLGSPIGNKIAALFVRP